MALDVSSHASQQQHQPLQATCTDVQNHAPVWKDMPHLQGPANIEIYEGLLMLQHRGQDSAGMVTLKGRKFIEYKANGLVKDVFNNVKTMDKLQGEMWRFWHTAATVHTTSACTNGHTQAVA